MFTLHETILSYMKLSGNAAQVGYLQMEEALNLSWYKLFKKTKESTVEKWIDVTKGVADYPKSVEKVLGLYVVDSCGDLAPLFRDNAKNILPKPATKCTCNACDAEECMCPSVQDSIVQTDVTFDFPDDDTVYTNKSHTRILKNGDVVEETYTWVPVYNANGVITSVQEVPAQRTICHVDVLPCGCVNDCEENATLLSKCGCLVNYCIPALRERYPALYNDFGYYKLDEDNKKVYLFDYAGKKSKITQVIFVYESNGSDMLVPQYAKSALIALLDWTRKMYSPMFDRFDRLDAKKNFAREKTEMLKELNPIPYELFVQTGDYYGNEVRRPYYGRIHSDFVETPAVATCASVTSGSASTIQYITNITNTTAPRVLKVVVDEPDGPVSGTNTYQNNGLIGLGGTLHRITIKVDGFSMMNWGLTPSFTYNHITGMITMLNNYLWPIPPVGEDGSTLEIDLNQ